MNHALLQRNGLIFVDEARAVGEDPRQFRVMAARGALIRVRRGVYCDRGQWDSIDSRERHVLRIRAVLHHLRQPALIAGYSAAAVWGVPVQREWPVDVTVLSPYRGGGTSEAGVHRTAAGARGAVSVRMGDIPVTTLGRTLCDVVRTEGFVGGTASVDWALREGMLNRSTLLTEFEQSTVISGRAGVARVIAFASPLSGSFGESLARATIHQLGFEPPELQREFRDAEGRMFADFFWPRYGIVAEFDGKIKYTREEYTRRDPSDAVWREKKREDRLRALGFRVLRLTYEHLHQGQRLAAALTAAGLPTGSGRLRKSDPFVSVARER